VSLTDQAEMRRFGSSTYTEGYDAYFDGILYEQNPYSEGAFGHESWNEGWIDAESSDCAIDNYGCTEEYGY
jgi:hypothetical protein